VKGAAQGFVKGDVRDRKMAERLQRIFGQNWKDAVRSDPTFDLVLAAAVARDVARKCQVSIDEQISRHSVADLVRDGGPRDARITMNEMQNALVGTIRRLAEPVGGLQGMPLREQDMREDVRIEADKSEARFYLDVAWTLLTDEQREALAARAHKSVVRMLEAQTLEPRLREVVLGFAATAIAEQLQEHETQLLERVRREVDARWASQVEAIVEARVADAIKRIKAEIAK